MIRGGYGLFYDTLNALNPQVNQSGFSTNTSVSSSTNYGVTYTAPLSNPFPANGGGVRFNTPIGSAAGALNFLGSAPTIYDQNLAPARNSAVHSVFSISLDRQHCSMLPTILRAAAAFKSVRTCPIRRHRFILADNSRTPFQVDCSLSQYLIHSLLANFSGVAARQSCGI